MIDVGISSRLFGSHVGWSTERNSCRRQLLSPGRLANRLRHTEIGDHSVVLGEQDVFRLYVSMNHAVLVSICQGVHHVLQDADRISDWQLALACKFRA